MADLPQLTPLGSILSYNNAAFSLAGRVVETLTGKIYEDALKELVLKPLGLKHSFLLPADVMTHSFAVGHTTIGERTVVLRPWQMTRACGPAGGITASTIDQLRYARFHLGDGTSEDGARILRPESIAMMQTPGSAGWLDIKMGLAWRTRDISGLRRIFHGGETHGQLSAFTMTPARKFGLALATNSTNGGLFILDVTKGLVAKFLGNDEPEPAEIPMIPSQLAEYSGRYTRASSDIEIKTEAGKLIMQLHPKGRISDQRHSTRPDSATISDRADRYRSNRDGRTSDKGHPGRVHPKARRPDRVAAMGCSAPRTSVGGLSVR
jgi:CubicO group peptidase (beta-lactamase class C family)